MDNLTHTLTGVALSRAGLSRFSPYSVWILTLSANAPDIDAVSLFGGSLAYLNWHRHFTHSLIFLPLMALLPVLIVRLAARRPIGWKGPLALATAGVASHLLLDLTNTYGVRLLLPFSNYWFSWNLANIVDVWIWAALLIAVLAPALSRLVSGEIGARPSSGRGFAIFALAFVLLYNSARAVLHARAIATLESRIYDDSGVLRVAAFPDAVNPLRWRSLVEGSLTIRLYDLRLNRLFDPAFMHPLYKPAESDAMRRAAATETFRDFLRFSQFPHWRVSETGDSIRVSVSDLRFGSPPDPSFVATAILDRDFNVIRAWFEFQPPL